MTQLLQMSLQGAVLIAAVLVLRALFARRMAPTVLYALWLIPAARLLIPGSVESVFSLQNLISPAAEEQAVAVIRQGALPIALEDVERALRTKLSGAVLEMNLKALEFGANAKEDPQCK